MNYVDPALRREIFGWHSHRLGLDMPIVRYGHFGRALLLLPTASGDFLEAERMWLIKSIEPLLLAGRVTVFSIDSINRHAWMNDQVGVAEAARRQALYSGYIEEEVVPHIRRVLQNPSARIGATGASFGAFYAANAVLRRPDLFDTLIAMSGFYDLGPTYLQGYGDDNVYFNNPTSYLPGLSRRSGPGAAAHRAPLHRLRTGGVRGARRLHPVQPGPLGQGHSPPARPAGGTTSTTTGPGGDGCCPTR